MKKLLLMKTMLLLCALIAGSGTMWADDPSWSHEFASPEAISSNSITVGGATWSVATIVKKGSPTIDKGNSYSKYCLKFGSGKNNCFSSITFSTDYFKDYNVTSVTVQVLHNSSQSGTLSATQGSTSIGSTTATVGSSWTDMTVNTTSGSGGTLSFTYSPTDCAVNIHSITVTYTTSGGGGSLTTSDLALTGAPIALNFDLYNNSTNQVINYTTSSTGAVTVSSSSYISTSVDSENKRITVTPTAVTPSTQTITVSQAADATYAAGSATFTVAVANSAPVINASNVNIEATATSGIISYSITNPEGGASLTASETEDWISDVTVDSENSKVTFTTTTNTSYVQRTGTITLTYGDDLATKDITVNQSSATPPGSKHEWDLSTNSYSSASASAVTWTSSYATMTNSTGSGTAANSYLPTTNTSSRFYKNNNLTITPSSGYKINGVVFTATTEGYASALGTSTWGNATAYVSNTKVTVIPTNGNNAISATIGGTCGFTKVEVYYELLPIPSIAVASTSIATTAAGTGGTISITYNNITDVMAEVQFFEADGTTPATYDWIDAEINGDNDVEYLIDANDGAARTAYMKVYALDDELNDVYSPLITITQAGIDYATLPFNWAGGTSSGLTALTGVTANGLGTDYAVDNAPYRVKMDNANDYIQIKTNAQPVKVLIGIKMIGGSTTSKIKVQESADGTSFTDVEELIISGAQNAILNLTTSNSFAASTRYVKIIKSVHGSNIGVGPIMVTDFDGIDVTITSAEYATYCNATYPLDFTGTGITAYTATDNTTSVTLNEITSGQVPANTPVVLYKAGGGTVNVPVKGSTTAVGANDLKVVGTGGISGVDNMYVLAKKSDIVGFYLWDKTKTLNEGKIYLDASTAGSRTFLGLGDDTTGIKSMNNGQLTIDNEAVYDLQGRKVAQPTKGLYIVNGKKVVKK